MFNEKYKPVIVPFIRRIFRVGIGYKKISCYVAYCGMCGNPINKYTCREFCRYCRCSVDWTGTRHIPWNRFKTDENAIKNTIDRI